MIDFARLTRPFSDDQIHYRVGSTNVKKVRRTTGNNQARPTSGLALGYIDQRDVQDRLDEVCGQAGWQLRHFDAGNGRLGCQIGILCGEEWIWKGDGAGGRQATQGLSEQDSNKGDFSDALKRAGVAWGIGRYLYDMKNQWVKLNDFSGIADGMRDILDRNHAMLAKGQKPPAIIQDEPAGDAKAKPALKPASKNVKVRDLYKRLSAKVQTFEVPLDLEIWQDDASVIAARKTLPDDWARDLTNEITERLDALTDRMARA